MTHTQGNGRRAVAITVAVTAAALTGCTSGSAAQKVTADTVTPSTKTSTTTSTTSMTSTTSTTSATEPSAPPATALACGTPPKTLVERAKVSIASHPGPVTATSYVFAATTDTGDWYVLGLDRTYVHDDGSTVDADGPYGDRSRSLALTNLARTTDGEVAMIPLSVAVSKRLPISWDHVSWTGETLAAGQRAAQRAMACLDEQG